MAYAAVRSVDNEKSLFIKTVESSFGLSVKSVTDGLLLVREAFRAFDSRSERHDESRVNLLFYKGKAYLNGFRPTTSFSNFFLRGKTFQPIQLCDILGFKREELEAFKIVKDCVDGVIESIENDYYTVRDFWYDARDKTGAQFNKILNKYIISSPDFLEEPLIKTSNFLIASRVIGFNTERSPFRDYVFKKAYDMTVEKNNEFLNKVYEYIMAFNPNEARKFKNMYLNGEIPELAPDIVYKQYSHTEYIVKYLMKKYENNNRDEITYMVTYNDMCDNCENLFLGFEPHPIDKIKTVVVSGYPYKNSRTKYVDGILYDTSMILIRLEEDDLENPYKYNIKRESFYNKNNNNNSSSYNNNNNNNNNNNWKGFSFQNSGNYDNRSINQSFNGNINRSFNQNFGDYDNKSFNQNFGDYGNRSFNQNFNNNWENSSNQNFNNQYNEVKMEIDDQQCPECGNRLIVKNGKFGKFMGCMNFPGCRYTKNIQNRF